MTKIPNLFPHLHDEKLSVWRENSAILIIKKGLKCLLKLGNEPPLVFFGDLPGQTHSVQVPEQLCALYNSIWDPNVMPVIVAVLTPNCPQSPKLNQAVWEEFGGFRQLEPSQHLIHGA